MLVTLFAEFSGNFFSWQHRNTLICSGVYFVNVFKERPTANVNGSSNKVLVNRKSVSALDMDRKCQKIIQFLGMGINGGKHWSK